VFQVQKFTGGDRRSRQRRARRMDAVAKNKGSELKFNTIVENIAE
jgi:hypothetical protein